MIMRKLLLALAFAAQFAAAQVTTNPGVTGVSASQSSVAITGGTINGTPIGATTPSSGAFTTLSATTALPVASGGTGVTTSTGTGNVVLSTSPTFVTPILGTPASGVATNLTGTAVSLTAGTAINQSGGTVSATTGVFSGNVGIIAAPSVTTGQLLTASVNDAANDTTIGVGNTNASTTRIAAFRMSTGASGTLWQIFARNGALFIGRNSVSDDVSVGGTGGFQIGSPTGADKGVGTLNQAGATYLNGALLYSATAPTISSGFGTSPSIASSNGSATFRVNVGTGGTATAGVVGLPTASNGWNCSVSEFNPNATALLSVTIITASTNASVSLSNNLLSTGAASAWQASQILVLNCAAY